MSSSLGSEPIDTDVASGLWSGTVLSARLGALARAAGFARGAAPAGDSGCASVFVREVVFFAIVVLVCSRYAGRVECVQQTCGDNIIPGYDGYLCKGNASVASASRGMRAHSGRLLSSYRSS